MSIDTKLGNGPSTAMLQEPLGSGEKTVTPGFLKGLAMTSPQDTPHFPNRKKVLSNLILAILAAYEDGMTHDEVRAICGAAWGDWQEKVNVSKISL